MANITSLGVGSTLDMSGIVDKLVTIKKAPIANLIDSETKTTAKVSALGQIKSKFADVKDLMDKLLQPSAWGARTATSSNASVATISAAETANVTSFSLEVTQLAKEQSAASGQITSGQPVGAGTLKLRLGTWGDAGAVAAAASASTTAASALADDQAAATAITAFASGTPANATTAGAYAVAYTAWVSAVGANDHATPSLQTAEADALAALSTAQAALDPADLAAINALPATVTADATDASALKGAAVSASATAFVASTSADVGIDISADDTVSTIADKINAANAGVTATVFNDGTTDRLLLRSASTGAVSGFRLQAFDTSGGALTGGTELSRLAFDPASGAFGMAGAGAGTVQYAQDAKASIDGFDVISSSNKLEGNLPGVTINLLATTGSTPLTMTVTKDTSPAVTSLTDFVTKYNALTDTLKELSKYDPATKVAGEFQGDSMIYTIENSLRSLISSSSMGASMQRLSDVGIELDAEGKLSLNVAKLTVAANNGNALQQLFANDNDNAQTNGFAVKMRDLAASMLDTTGSLALKSASLQKALDDNAAEQTKVSDEVAAFEARLRAQYAVMDAQISQSNSISKILAAQVAAYNKNSS